MVRAVESKQVRENPNAEITVETQVEAELRDRLTGIDAEIERLTLESKRVNERINDLYAARNLLTNGLYIKDSAFACASSEEVGLVLPTQQPNMLDAHIKHTYKRAGI